MNSTKMLWIGLALAGRSLAQTTEIASVSTAGALGDAQSQRPSVSADGRWLAFSSRASTLVPEGSNGLFQVYLRDLRSRETTRLAAELPVEPAGDVYFPALSPTGQLIVFVSNAGNLVEGDTDGASDLFLFDRQSRTIRLLSDGIAGGTTDAVPAYTPPRFSADERFVAFECFRTTFAHEIATGDTRAGSLGDDESVSHVVLGSEISGTGRFVAFSADTDSLVAGDTNWSRDVFVHDRDLDGNGVFDEPGLRRTVRVSIASDGSQADAGSFPCSISADGRYVVFASLASNLVRGDASYTQDVFLHDRDADGNGTFDEAGGRTTVRVSVDANGVALLTASYQPWISPDGRFITFTSDGRLTSDDLDDDSDVYLVDRDGDGNGVLDEPGTVAPELLSAGGVGLERSPCHTASPSADARRIAFVSSGPLLASDVNGFHDVYVRTRRAVIITALAPSVGDVRGGDLVRISGTNFTISVPTVRFGSGGASVVEATAERLIVRTPPGSGIVDVVVENAWSVERRVGGFEYLEPSLAARPGNVNAGIGLVEDVLLVNGSPGDGAERTVFLSPGERVGVAMLPPSSALVAPFAVFVWRDSPRDDTVSRQPRRVGRMVLPTPLQGLREPQPIAIGNGLDARLGTSTFAVVPAPTLVGVARNGVGRRLTVTLQGFIRDDGALTSTGVSITNAVILVVK